MKKYSIGFRTKGKNIEEKEITLTANSEMKEPKKSVVQVYFPHRGKGWAYYNDSFDLKVGDIVYVEGKLAGYRGRVTAVNYSFKIKLSDYKKVIAGVDTDVKGDFYFAGSHLVSFDKNAIPYSKALAWVKTPLSDEEYVIGDDYENGFPLDDLSKMNVSHDTVDSGYEYFMQNKVSYVEIDGGFGRAIVEGSEIYEIEFNYSDGEISNLKCNCFCSGVCKHGVAAIMQLDETLKIITEKYEDKYKGYFAVVCKGMFIDTPIIKKVSGKIGLGD